MEGQIVSIDTDRKPENGLTVLVQVTDSPDAFQTVGFGVHEVIGSTLVDDKPQGFHRDGMCWHGKAPNPADPDGHWLPVRTEIFLHSEAAEAALVILDAIAGCDNPLSVLIKRLEQEAFDTKKGPTGFREEESTYTGELADRLRDALTSIFDQHAPRVA